MRFSVVCALSLLVWMPQPALTARFIGNMAFAISDGTVTLMTDFPYQSGYSGYMSYAATEIRSSTASTLALITHRHADHWEPSLFRQTDWKVAGPADVVVGLPADRVVPLDDKTAFGPLLIERLATPHARIGHYSYIVTWHGKRLYFSGDTEGIETLLAATDLDVAFISPWQYRAVVRASGGVASPRVDRSVNQPRQLIDAERIVIYHHAPGEAVAQCRDRCLVPRQGETISIR